jgi:hypothetical protein
MKKLLKVLIIILIILIIIIILNNYIYPIWSIYSIDFYNNYQVLNKESLYDYDLENNNERKFFSFLSISFIIFMIIFSYNNDQLLINSLISENNLLIDNREQLTNFIFEAYHQNNQIIDIIRS